MLNILLIEEYIILRTGIKALIDVQPEFKLAAVANSIQEAITITPLLGIDLIITDISADHQRIRKDIEELQTAFPEARILVFTWSPNEEAALASVQAGAAGYLFKEASGEELLQTLDQLLGGTASAEISTARIS